MSRRKSRREQAISLISSVTIMNLEKEIEARKGKGLDTDILQSVLDEMRREHGTAEMDTSSLD